MSYETTGSQHFSAGLCFCFTRVLFDIICMVTGERRTGEFPPNTSLFELANTLAPAELSSLTRPSIMYMRQEVAGELALRDKTLRQLGLIGGRAVLRLLNKAEEAM